MSDENRDSATGQFTSAEPAYGLESVERDAGYVPYKPEAAEEPAPEEFTVKDAAESYLSRTPQAGIRTYGAVDHLPDNVSLTAEQAAELVAEKKAEEAKAREEAEDNEFRDEVDELRGVKKSEAKDAKDESAADKDAQPVRDGDLDPEIEKALNNPKIQAALSQQVGEAEAARQHHLAGLNAATQIAQTTFMSQFPEFAQIPPENMAAAVQAMIQQDPARAAQVAAAIQRTAGLFEQQRIASMQEAHAKQAQFKEFVKTENAKFEALVKGESAETLKAAPKLIREALTEYGVDLEEFGRLLGSSELVNHSAVQRLLIDAAKYRQIAKATRPVPQRPPVPKVQRPGTARAAGERDTSHVAALGQRLSQSGSMEDAFAHYTARKKARG